MVSLQCVSPVREKSLKRMKDGRQAVLRWEYEGGAFATKTYKIAKTPEALASATQFWLAEIWTLLLST